MMALKRMIEARKDTLQERVYFLYPITNTRPSEVSDIGKIACPT